MWHVRPQSANWKATQFTHTVHKWCNVSFSKLGFLFVFLRLICFPFSECICCFQVLDEWHPQGLAGPLFHQHDNPGRPGVLGHCDAHHCLQTDPHQGWMEAEPCGFFQHLGSQLSLWDNLGSDLPGLWTSLWCHSLPVLHPQLFSRSVLGIHCVSSTQSYSTTYSFQMLYMEFRLCLYSALNAWGDCLFYYNKRLASCYKSSFCITVT